MKWAQNKCKPNLNKMNVKKIWRTQNELIWSKCDKQWKWTKNSPKWVSHKPKICIACKILLNHKESSWYDENIASRCYNLTLFWCNMSKNMLKLVSCELTVNFLLLSRVHDLPCPICLLINVNDVMQKLKTFRDAYSKMIRAKLQPPKK